MARKHSRPLEIKHKVLDILIIQAAWWLSYFIRFQSNLFEVKDIDRIDWYSKYSVLLIFISYYFLSQEQLYNSRRITPLFKDLFGVMKANTISFAIFLIGIYFLSGHKVSRIFIIFYFFISTFLLMVSKFSTRAALKSSFAKGKNVRGVFFIGNTPKLLDYADKIERHPEYGMKITKWLKEECDLDNIDVNEIEKENPSSVVIGVPNHCYHKISNLLRDLNNSLIEVIVLPDLAHAFVGYQIVDMSGITAILINEPNLSNRSVILKRLFDILASGIGLIVLSPFLFLIAVLVKLTSKGPIFYGQVRMGLDGHEFLLYKFRSMGIDPSNKETWTVKNDPRVTPLGKFLRQTSLDEFPQLFNVLKGDMSLVGPRPERPMYVSEFRKDIPTYMLRHKMKAGITGWAQVNGWRGDTSIEKRIECDLYYIKNWSIWFDIWIILMTFWKGFIHKHAY
jgi:Undecaprenyl-phosphate glucose phosphotransferase